MYRFCPQCGAKYVGAHDPRHSEPFAQHCAECDYTFFHPLRTTCSALIFQDQKLLLVRRAFAPEAGTWGLAGGFVQPNEHPEGALIRELREELGVESKIIRLHRISSPGRYMYKGVEEFTCDHCYLVTLLSQELKVADDVTECQWFSRNELVDLSGIFTPIQDNLRLVIGDDTLWEG